MCINLVYPMDHTLLFICLSILFIYAVILLLVSLTRSYAYGWVQNVFRYRQGKGKIRYILKETHKKGEITGLIIVCAIKRE